MLSSTMPKPPSQSSLPLAARVFLVLLRLAIGWHLFIEGASKLETFATGPTGTSKPFSSRGYLQQSQGPLAPLFHSIAGDPDQELLLRLDVGSEAVPAALRSDWQDFVNRYVAHYGLDEGQKAKAQELLQQHLTKLGDWFQHGTKAVTRDYSFGTITPVESTPSRITEYRRKLGELQEKSGRWDERFAKDVAKSKLTALRSEVSKLRTELQKDLDDQQQLLRQDLDKLLNPQQADKDIEGFKPALLKALKIKGYQAENQACGDLLAATSAAKRGDLLAMAEANPEQYLAELQNDAALKSALLKVSKQNAAPPLHVEHSWMLDVTDETVAWGLTLTGIGLLLGCFTRSSCIVGACLLLLFYLALPPLPGLPDNPMAEGKYLIVNKNLIEAIALLALATLRTGSWFGVDALLRSIRPFRRERNEGVAQSSV
jgi:uncharacterized membrane protein YphA (DoxX/SURF4 family)